MPSFFGSILVSVGGVGGVHVVDADSKGGVVGVTGGVDLACA